MEIHIGNRVAEVELVSNEDAEQLQSDFGLPH